MSLDDISNKISNIVKSSGEIVSIDLINCIVECMKEEFTGLKVASNIAEFLYSIPNRIFFSKLQDFFEGSYCQLDLETRVNFSKKFADDNYEKYVKRQLELIDSINDSGKIEYLANLTRACIMGFIDTSIYFKLSYIINQATKEELDYLSQNIDKPIEYNNAYVFSLQQIGLIKELIISGFGQNNSEYEYTEFAMLIDKFAIKYNKIDQNYEYDSSKMITLEKLFFSDSKINARPMTDDEVTDLNNELFDMVGK